MAYFAEIQNNEIIQVIAISNNDVDNLPFPESEPIGQAFIASVGIVGEWLQTSYSGSYRGIYAGIGFTFNPWLGEYGEFVAPEAPPVE